MNKYRKLVSYKNKKKKYKVRKTLKASHMLKKKKNKTLVLSKKFRNRNQIGCSRKNNMIGGGVSIFQPITDVINGIGFSGTSLVSNFAGTQNPPDPSPLEQYK